MTNVAATNPGATLIQARSNGPVDEPELDSPASAFYLIEDGPTLTHGEMAYGSGGSSRRTETMARRRWSIQNRLREAG